MSSCGEAGTGGSAPEDRRVPSSPMDLEDPHCFESLAKKKMMSWESPKKPSKVGESGEKLGAVKVAEVGKDGISKTFFVISFSLVLRRRALKSKSLQLTSGF